MQSFSYTAYTPEGHRRTGTHVAESARAVYAALAAQGLMPEAIDPQKYRSLKWRSQGLSTAQQGIFLRHMAVLLDADLSISASLEAVEATVDCALSHRFYAALRVATLEGMTLADALEKERATLPPAYVAAIRAGERAGTLASVFERLATFHEAQSDTRASVATALIYPGLVAAMSIGVCLLLVILVAPQLVNLFASTGQPLPAITQGMIAGSDWLARYWPVVSAIMIGAAFAACFAATKPRLRDWAARGRLRIPIARSLTEARVAATYLRTFALVVQSRSPPIDAFRASETVLLISDHRHMGVAATAGLHEGKSLAQAVSGLTFLPPIARHLLATGEATARLGAMSDRAATVAETLLARQQKRLIAVIDPLLMIGVGAIVLTVVLAVLLPIFDLQTAMQL